MKGELKINKHIGKQPKKKEMENKKHRDRRFDLRESGARGQNR